MCNLQVIPEGRNKKIASRKNDFLWIKLDKSFFGLKQDLYICNCYIPPETSEVHKISGAPYFEIFNEEVIKFSTQGEILLLGDMNSRPGEQKENYTEIDEDITVRDQLCVEDITSSDRVVYCLPDRKNEDIKVNSFGRNLISITEQAHLAIVNGRKLGDLRGKTTCVTYNGMSTVD